METYVLAEIIRPLLTVGLIGFVLWCIKKVSAWMSEKDKADGHIRTDVEVLKQDIKYIDQRYNTALLSTDKRLEHLQRTVESLRDNMVRVTKSPVDKGRRWYDVDENPEDA